MTAKDNVYTSVFNSYGDGDKVTPYRQTLEFLDDDHVVWTVLDKKGDEWVALHTLSKEMRASRDKEPATRSEWDDPRRAFAGWGPPGHTTAEGAPGRPRSWRLVREPNRSAGEDLSGGVATPDEESQWP